jgi:hypothetical protein
MSCIISVSIVCLSIISNFVLGCRFFMLVLTGSVQLPKGKLNVTCIRHVSKHAILITTEVRVIRLSKTILILL